MLLRHSILGCILALLISTASLCAQPLENRPLDDWLRYLLPNETESQWSRLPWHPTLWQAVVKANQEDRPILLWAMYGHPLVST